jgi:xeroderma pigmentosum group C-complementing protein
VFACTAFRDCFDDDICVLFVSYALERQLKKFEIIHPRVPIIGHFKGEPVFPRSNVRVLHTAESWLKEGRQIKIGEQPLKHVKSRALTLNKRRAINLAEYNDEAPPESGLYGEWQTEKYQPKPVVEVCTLISILYGIVL